MTRLLTILLCCLCLTVHAQSEHQAEAADSVFSDLYATALARAFYDDNHFDASLATYDQADTATMAVVDLSNYAMAAYFKHQYQRALDLACYGLTRQADHLPFTRIAFFCSTMLHRDDDALRYADTLFSHSDTTNVYYYDYIYLVQLLSRRPTLSDTDRQHMVQSCRQLISYYQQQPDGQSAVCYYAQKLLTIVPDDEQAKQLLH